MSHGLSRRFNNEGELYSYSGPLLPVDDETGEIASESHQDEVKDLRVTIVEWVSPEPDVGIRADGCFVLDMMERTWWIESGDWMDCFDPGWQEEIA